MPNPGLTLDTKAAFASVLRFDRELLAQAEVAAKAATVSGVSNLLARLEGHSNNPERIDTSQLHDNWALAAAQATGKSVGTTSAAGPGAGVGSITIKGKKVQVDLFNIAPYADYVEYGTPKMQAGYHVTDSLRDTNDNSALFLDPAMQAAWGAA